LFYLYEIARKYPREKTYSSSFYDSGEDHSEHKYIIEALGRFMKILKQKRSAMAVGQWWFHTEVGNVTSKT
jgi:hypothetical protein